MVVQFFARVAAQIAENQKRLDTITVATQLCKVVYLYSKTALKHSSRNCVLYGR